MVTTKREARDRMSLPPAVTALREWARKAGGGIRAFARAGRPFVEGAEKLVRPEGPGVCPSGLARPREASFWRDYRGAGREG